MSDRQCEQFVLYQIKDKLSTCHFQDSVEVWAVVSEQVSLTSRCRNNR